MFVATTRVAWWPSHICAKLPISNGLSYQDCEEKTISKDLNNQIFNFALAQDDDTSQNVMKCPLAVLHLSQFYNILRSIIILGPGKFKYCSLLIIMTFRNRFFFFIILIRHTVVLGNFAQMWEGHQATLVVATDIWTQYRRGTWKPVFLAVAICKTSTSTSLS